MMTNPVCPHCGSEDIHTTDKFDGTVIEPSEAILDFACDDCGCLFQIIYSPIDTRIVSLPDEEECLKDHEENES